MEIESAIMEGKNNAVSMEYLAHLFNVPERIIRREIEEARISRGQLIIGDSNGYYFPSDDSDISGYIKRKQASIRTSRKSLTPFLKALRR